MSRIILKNALLAGRTSSMDIEVTGQAIARMQADIRVEQNAREIDLNGALLFPGFVETHIQLDKSCLLHRTLHKYSGCKALSNLVERLHS